MAFIQLYRLKSSISGSIRSRHFTSESKFLEINIDNKTGIAVVSLNRPPANPMSISLANELKSTLLAAEKENVRGLILKSKKDGTFCAGNDLFEVYQRDSEFLENFCSSLQQMWITLYRTPFPTAAVINGHAFGGGCLLALLCEYRVIRRGYTMGFNEVKFGFIVPETYTTVMEDVIGQRKTEIAISIGTMFTAEDALKVGLVDDVVDSSEDGVIKSECFFDKFKNISPKARSLSKSLARSFIMDRLLNNLNRENDHFQQFAVQPDVQNLLGNYLETLKRKK